MKGSVAFVLCAMAFTAGAGFVCAVDGAALQADLRVARQTAFVCGYTTGFDRAAKVTTGKWDPQSLTERCRRELADANTRGLGRKLKTAAEE